MVSHLNMIVKLNVKSCIQYRVAVRNFCMPLYFYAYFPNNGYDEGFSSSSYNYLKYNLKSVRNYA